MSSPMKLSLLALISSAVAAPHNAFHRRHGGYGTGTGAPYPTGPWGNNGTAYPTGTGAAVPSDVPDTTLLETMFSTQTVYSTIYASKPAQSAGAEDVSSAAPVCGPGGTVTVTATNKVTVTVPAGGASVVPSSSAAAVESSVAASSVAAVESSAAASSVVASSAAASSSVSAPAEGYGSYVLPSSSLVEKAPTSSAAAVESSSAAGYSILPVTSAAPATSAAPVTSAAPASSSAVVEEKPSSTVAASSSAAPSSSSTPSYSGGKRGLAYNDASLLEAFGSGSFGFTYNWAQTGDSANFVPMMHKPSDSTAEDWLANVDTAVKGGSSAVMGFNEPDIASQANMSPEAACSAWVEYMNPIASAHPDVTILGPSVSNSGSDGQGLSWLSSFASSCSNAVYHAANIHFYDIADGALERFKSHIEEAATQTGMPVWVTEFGLNPGASDQEAADFLTGAMEYMEGSDSVKGYAYFMVGTGQCQLNSGSGLSAIGKVYAS